MYVGDVMLGDSLFLLKPGVHMLDLGYIQYICTYVHAYMHTYIHAYIHTYIYQGSG